MLRKRSHDVVRVRTLSVRLASNDSEVVDKTIVLQDIGVLEDVEDAFQAVVDVKSPFVRGDQCDLHLVGRRNPLNSFSQEMCGGVLDPITILLGLDHPAIDGSINLVCAGRPGHRSLCFFDHRFLAAISVVLEIPTS
jgi:hypothetical protein